MSMEALTSVRGNSYPAPSIHLKPEVTTQKMQEIQRELHANGTKQIGEEAFQKAIQKLEKMMTHKDIQVSNYVDTETGVRKVVFTDTETGKVIREMPPDAVIEMVRKSKHEVEGWILNTFA